MSFCSLHSNHRKIFLYHRHRGTQRIYFQQSVVDTWSKRLRCNFFNSSTKFSNQKISYFHLPAKAIKCVHGCQLNFPPSRTLHSAAHEVSYSDQVRVILNRTTYFMLWLHISILFYQPYKVA